MTKRLIAALFATLIVIDAFAQSSPAAPWSCLRMLINRVERAFKTAF